MSGGGSPVLARSRVGTGSPRQPAETVGPVHLLGLEMRRAIASSLTLDTLGTALLGRDGHFTEFLRGMLIQGAEPPPEFVDPAWVRTPDLVCVLGGDDLRPEPVRRVYDFVQPAAIPDITVEAWRSKIAQAKLHPQCKRVARALSAYATFATGKDVRPAMGTVAAELGKPRTTVNKHTRRLVNDGWLVGTGKAEKGVIIYALAVPDEKVTHNPSTSNGEGVEQDADPSSSLSIASYVRATEWPLDGDD